MKGEIFRFFMVWLLVFVSLCYCYLIKIKVRKGTRRLLLVLPVICLFLYLPLYLSSAHLGGVTSFFIAWLANFKLLLFAFDKGPLSPSDQSITLPLFIALSCLPIKIQQDPTSEKQPPQRKSREGPLNYTVKILLLAILLRVRDYTHHFHPNLLLFLYAFHVYFLLEIILVVGATLARTVLGLELEPQFNEPYLATSLQDFWGKRWNLMVTNILRPTVYEPTLHFSSRLFGRNWAPLPATFSTFVVSAVMHEVIFFHLVRVGPTWEITWFFLLHGICLTFEIGLKKALKGRRQLPAWTSRGLTVGFVMITGFWLFFPKFVESKLDVRAFEEYAAIGAFFANVKQKVTASFDQMIVLRSNG
ncbi:hypothetical protein K2173_011330 [Erythroxylum novogranatense]|uniref:Wax synthase domain-containing protein n=1 Tax=Erythroxylum novogranatense TaxID=1862640 RepID=A0AAV8S9R6_9ROSI|nr:hypothetical protein K2173_011330 [Erythroxylum novogranatense]